MNSFSEFQVWCQAKLLQFQTYVRRAVSKEKPEHTVGPCLTPETVPKFVIPDPGMFTQSSKEKNLCGDEELVLNAGLPFHIHEKKKTTGSDCTSKLDLLKQKQFQAYMSSRKTHESNQSSICEVYDTNDEVYGKYTLEVCPQSDCFPEIEGIPSVYFGQLDQQQTGSFYKKLVTRKSERHMLTPYDYGIVDNHAAMESVGGMDVDPLPRRQSSSRSPRYTRRRSSLPYLASMSESNESDIGMKNSIHKTTSPNLSQGFRSPGSTKGISTKLRAKLGELKFEFTYLRNKKQLKVLLLRGENVGGYKKSDYNMNAFVRLCLMPDKLQPQFSTVQRHTTDPRFNEEFYFSNIKLRNVQEMTLQMKIYNNMPRRPSETIGEINVELFKYDILAETRLWREIEKTTNKTHDIGHISLSVNLNTCHKELQVTIGRVTGLRSADKSDGTYVAVDVSQHFEDTTQQRTRDQQNSSYPVFNETLTFDLPLVALSDLMTTSIIVSVFKIDLFCHDIMLGQVFLGCNSTEDSERLHWQELVHSQGQAIDKWHYLML